MYAFPAIVDQLPPLRYCPQNSTGFYDSDYATVPEETLTNYCELSLTGTGRNIYDFTPSALELRKWIIADGYCPTNFTDAVNNNFSNKFTVADGYCPTIGDDLVAEGYVNRNKIFLADGYCPTFFTDNFIFTISNKIFVADGYCPLVTPV